MILLTKWADSDLKLQSETQRNQKKNILNIALFKAIKSSSEMSRPPSSVISSLPIKTRFSILMPSIQYT